MSENQAAEELVSIAKIGRYRGNQGEVFIHPYFDLAHEELQDIEAEIRWPGGKRVVKSRLLRIWWQGKKAICKLQGSETIDDARDLVHAEIYILKSNLKPLEEDQYFKSDLIGLEVQNFDGEKLGKVSDIIETDASALLQLDNRGILIPMVPAIVVEINLDAGVIIVDPPEGLLELNED